MTRLFFYFSLHNDSQSDGSIDSAIDSFMSPSWWSWGHLRLFSSPTGKTDLYISQDWGASCDVDDVSIKWHIPSLEEKTFAKELLETFLLPVLDRLTRFTQGNEMTRYVLRHLSGKKPVFHLPRPLSWMYCTCHVLGGGGCSIYRLCILCIVILPLLLNVFFVFRDELQHSVDLVHHILQGSCGLLPRFQGPFIDKM